MPVSPQDFALWSDLTGNPYPSTPAERMAMAPEVYQFTRGIGRRGGYGMSPVRKAVDVVGKAALGAGLLAGAAYLGSKYGSPPPPPPSGGGFASLELDDEPGVPPTPNRPFDPTGAVARISGDVTFSSPGEHYGQYLNTNQTSAVQELRGLSPAQPTRGMSEQAPIEQVSQLSETQTPSPRPSVRERAEELVSAYSGEGVPTGAELVGGGTTSAVESFRQSPQYAQMMGRSAPLAAAEELVDDRTPVPFSSVRSTPATRAVVEPQSTTGAIAEMATPAKVVPIEEAVTVSQTSPTSSPAQSVLASASPQEIAEARITARRALGHLPEDQAVELLLGTKKQAIVTRQPEVLRVAESPLVETAATPRPRITPNEFLSAMSQEQGPLATYDIPSERSKAVTGLNFYPGGEMGVTMRTKGKPTEYAYATSDPYRLAMRDYAEEGFPESMGNIASIAANRALAHQLGLQKAVEIGGTIQEKRQPIHTGLMSDVEIATVLNNPKSHSRRAVEMAQKHFETKDIMRELEERASARRAGLTPVG